jgi:transcription initiation factor TFIIIB Brf1 subunit/transcription initiation factor TFIIB
MAGFNTETKRLAAVFHVQTQDVGPSTRYVESLIYKSGKLVSSRKTDYTSSLASPQLQARVRQIMEEQHNAILKEIADGRFDQYLTPEEKNPLPDKD